MEDSGPEVAQSIPGDGAEQSDSGGGGSGDGGGGGDSNSAGENDDGHSERDATSVAAGSDIVLSVSPVASPTTNGTPPLPPPHTPHPQRTRMHSTRTLTNHNRLLERAA